jgi:LysR family glycine cleavage system transcriptional activator
MRRLPPLSALRTFEAVARLGSFRLAAEELSVTTTAVSHQIAGLEGHCGQTLFRRRPRPVTLTDAGERLFPFIRDGLDLFAAGIEQIGEGGRSARRLRVSTTNAFAARCLVPMLPHWHRENPAVELEVIGTDAVANLHAREVDVALRYAREMPRDGIALELARDRFHVVAAPSLLGPGGTRSWQRLPRIAYDWLPGDTKAPTWERWESLARVRPAVKGRIAMHFREELHAIGAVVAGQGVAICSDLLVRKELSEGLLVPLSPLTLEGYGLYLVTLPDRATDGAVQTFCAWMRRMFTPLATIPAASETGARAAR